MQNRNWLSSNVRLNNEIAIDMAKTSPMTYLLISLRIHLLLVIIQY